MVHLSHLISAAALVSVSSAVPMVRRHAPSSTMNAYSTYQTGSYQASSSNKGNSYGSNHDSSYGNMDSSYGNMNNSYTAVDSSYGNMNNSYTAVDSSYGNMNNSWTAVDSSYGSSDSSYGSSDSSNGSYDSSYGSSDSSYGNNWNSMSTETMMDVMTSTSSSYTSSSYISTQTSSALNTQATYGSGSASWSGSSGYDSCVQQCLAQYGAPPTLTMPPSEEVTSTSTSSSASVTHTIIVGPAQGSLRYMPFATNASVGDAVTFKWVAGTHTVTQSSGVEVCNKTANGFASGMRSAGSEFTQVINDTKPIWFYCGVPGHCEQGMYGGINIGNPVQTSDSGSDYMPISSVVTSMVQEPDVSAAWNYTNSVVASNSSISTWGNDINCAGMDDQTKKSTLMNVLYSRAVMAMNPDVFQNGRVVNASGASALKLPTQQFAAQVNTTQTNMTSSGSNPASPTSGVESLLAPRYFVALVALLASLAIF